MLPGVGIFGTGLFAKIIALHMKQCGFNIVAVWSRTLKTAESFAKDLNIPFFTNKVDDLLLKNEVGFVIINCTPHLQSPIAVKALSIGKHVIASWPAGTSQVEVLKMVKAATYYPSLLSMMFHGLRFLPSISLMKQKIQSGYIGQLFLFEVRVNSSMKLAEYGWHCDNMMGGGALSMHGSYIIDTVSYVSGKSVKAVTGMMKTYIKNTDNICGVREITCDEFCSFQMELEDGISVSCVINTLGQGFSSHEIVAVGSKGRLTARDSNLFANLDDQISDILLHIEPNDKSKGNDESVPFYRGLQNALERIAKAFQLVEAMHQWDSNLIPERATFEDALHVQTVVDAIRKSNQMKEWVTIKILDEEPDPNPHLSAVVRRSAYSVF